MKRLLLAILILIQFPVLSQSLDGKFQLGGSASYFTNNSEYESGSGIDYRNQIIERTNFSITPQFGYFISDNISIGGQIGYSRASFLNYYESGQNTMSDYNRKDNTFRFGTFTRVHKSIKENLYLFLQGNIEVGFGKIRYEESQNNDLNSFDFHAGIQPGILFMITEKFGIEGKYGLLGYNSSKTSSDDPNENVSDVSQRFGLDFNPGSFALGLQFYL
ncbi:hypothetical protein QYS49_22895 [Marivirga salinae]|uniref:Outer membrane protein beta-barrel domain-containing protein n=1 Tax=Marivirga salinarum TaxID=3059078 RepID=A0AA49GD60_9BACT|nr:hypothetical protein [Marivirga sp. BDSF4-3]WKK74547.2 hypothetical protein QYS49_22895 [Marivirga sp. BDSF4-3]